MRKIEAIRMIEAMRTQMHQQQLALWGLHSQVAPGSVSVGLGADLRADKADRLELQAQIEDAVTTSANHAGALDHIAMCLTVAAVPDER